MSRPAAGRSARRGANSAPGNRAAADAVRLTWDGRRAVAPAPSPTQFEEQCRCGGGAPLVAGWTNRLVLGDNLDVLSAWANVFHRTIRLVYIDPPFGLGSPRHLAGGGVAFPDGQRAGLAGYMQDLSDRLHAIVPLLSDDASLYVHLDPTVAHYVKVLLDEVLGRDCFQREIVWRIGWVSGFKTRVRNWVRNHDTLLFYTRDPHNFVFHKPFIPHPAGYVRRRGAATASRGIAVDDVWNASPADRLNSIQIVSYSKEKTGYPTQKNLDLLARIVGASSDPNDIVADLYCGSGTTLVAAERLGRRWLGCDREPQAVAIAQKRLQALPAPRPFGVWRVRGAAEGRQVDSAVPGEFSDSPAGSLTRGRLPPN